MVGLLSDEIRKKNYQGFFQDKERNTSFLLTVY